MDMVITADHRIKLKESDKSDKYQDLARELKKLRNIKEAIKPIAIGALVTVTERLLQHCWDWSEYQEESRRLEETYYHSEYNGKPLANDVRRTPKWVW